jgi:hypothetical protein
MAVDTWVCVHGAGLAGRKACLRSPEVAVKLSIKAELAYSFADTTQIIANIEASDTSDQSILSETLDIQPPAKFLSDKTAYGDRRIRASLSGDVNIRYVALVENNVRRLLPKSGRQHLWSDLPSDVLPFLLPSRFCPSDKFMRFAQREFAGAGDGVARIMAMLEWIHRKRRLRGRSQQRRDNRGTDIRRPRRGVPRLHSSGDHLRAGFGNSCSRGQRLRLAVGSSRLPRDLRGLHRKRLVADRSDKARADRGYRAYRKWTRRLGYRLPYVGPAVPGNSTDSRGFEGIMFHPPIRRQD